MSLIPLGQGSEFSCFVKESNPMRPTVVKYSIVKHTSPSEAEKHRNRFLHDYHILEEYLGGYLAPTTYEVEEIDCFFRIVATQPLITGIKFSEGIAKMQHRFDEVRDQRMVDFLQRSLHLYDATAHFPDIYGSPAKPNKFRIHTTNNIVIETNTPIWNPVLIDPSFGQLAERVPMINAVMANLTGHLLESIAE